MLSLLALPNAYTLGGVRARSPARMGASPVMGWDMKTITPDGTLEQRVEGKTRKTWTFNDLSKDRVQVAVKSEVRNVGEYEFPFSAAANYADASMASKADPPAAAGERVDGGALRSFPLDAGSEKLEVVLNTDGKQLNARVELLNAPNNPKQTFEVFTNNGELNSLSVCFDTPDPGNTVRIVNLAPVEFPCYIHLNEM